MLIRRIPLMLTLVSALLAGAVQAQGPIGVGSRLEPLWDDHLIEKMDGVRLMLHNPVVREKVFSFDAPWEGDSSAYVTVLHDGEKYRMYYRGSSATENRPEVTCVAESADGIRFTRPNLGIHEFNGSKQNNIVWMVQGGHAFSPFKDSNPNARPDELYKAVAPMNAAGRGNALFAYTSPDGYHWKQVGDKPVITEGGFDSHNVACWDTERGEYVSYFRGWRGVRDILRSTSKDFVTWTKPEWLVYTGAPSEHLYTNAIIQYPRAPHIYVGFPKRFLEGRKVVESHPVPGASDGVFMSSRDGLNFYRWPEAFMRPGTDPKNWTDRNIMAAWGIFELTPGEVSIYYSQHYRHPTAHMVRATVRTDGFVSVNAGYGGGEFVTKPLTFEGKELVINYSTSAPGQVQVEVQDASGQAFPGFTLDDCPPIYGDEIERVVEWKGGSDLSSLAGKPIKLRVRMKDADLYSVRFR